MSGTSFASSDLIRSLLLVAHLVSFALAFGTVLVCDVLMLRALTRPEEKQGAIRILRFASRIVVLGLAGLIVSGLGFLVFYFFFESNQLANPKLYAKIASVLVLSLNGAWLHRKGLRLLQADVITPSLFAAGAVSAVSWWYALILGAVKQLNFAYSFASLFGIYIGAVAAAVIGAMVFYMLFARLRKSEASISLELS